MCTFFCAEQFIFEICIIHLNFLLFYLYIFFQLLNLLCKFFYKLIHDRVFLIKCNKDIKYFFGFVFFLLIYSGFFLYPVKGILNLFFKLIRPIMIFLNSKTFKNEIWGYISIYSYFSLMI